MTGSPSHPAAHLKQAPAVVHNITLLGAEDKAKSVSSHERRLRRKHPHWQGWWILMHQRGNAGSVCGEWMREYICLLLPIEADLMALTCVSVSVSRMRLVGIVHGVQGS
jgi:hypothetical protein